MRYLTLSKCSWLLTLTLAVMLVSCNQRRDMIATNPSSSTLQDSEKIIFSSLYPDIGYTALINGEPVACGTTPGHFITSMFPLRKGTNHISVTLSFLPRDKVPPKDKVYVYDWDFRTQLRNEIPSVRFYESSIVPHNTNLLTWERDCQITNAASPGINFENIGANRDEFVKECCNASRKLAGLIQKQDTMKLAAVLSLSESDVEQQFVQTKGLSDVAVGGGGADTKVTAVCGTYFVVVFCGDNQRVNIGESFVTLSHKEGNDQTTFVIDHMLFARQNGKMLVRGVGDKWMVINAELL